jgi:hypothetical protein
MNPIGLGPRDDDEPSYLHPAKAASTIAWGLAAWIALAALAAALASVLGWLCPS